MALHPPALTPLAFGLGFTLALWGCAPEEPFGPASEGQGSNLGYASDYEANPAETEAHELVNDYRTDEGLGAMAFRDEAGDLARSHSYDMASGGAGLGHEGFEERAEEILDLLPGATAVGENVGRVDGAFDETEAAEAMLLYWQDSPDHDANLLDEGWTLAGTGAVLDGDDRWWFTQLYVSTN